jgi:hypothetical protein
MEANEALNRTIVRDNGYQYMPTYDYRQDGEGLGDLSDGIVPTPPPHLEPVEPRQPQESELHTTTEMEAFKSLVDEVLVAQKEHADFIACPNVPKVSRKPTEEGHTEERMEKGEFSDTPYITRGGLKREKTMHFQGSHNSNDSHDDRELHEDELSSGNRLRLSSDSDPAMHLGNITATPTLPRAKSSSITPPQMRYYTPPEWPVSP